MVRCVEAGAEDYLTKPFNATLLKARIGASLEKKRGRDRESALFEQLQNNYKRLQELEQQRDDMRNMIVHDLRTPLTALIVGIEMLEMGGALSGTQQEITAIAAGRPKISKRTSERLSLASFIWRGVSTRKSNSVTSVRLPSASVLDWMERSRGS